MKIVEKAKNFWSSLDEEKTVVKKELFLEITTCVLGGLVVGMFFSPKKNVTMGSYNCDNGSGNHVPCDEYAEE